jgi:hypothetical protein
MKAQRDVKGKNDFLEETALYPLRRLLEAAVRHDG